MDISFDGEAWDTEERILDSLANYTVELEFSIGNDEWDTMDVEFLGSKWDDDTAEIVLVYRDFNAEDGTGEGPKKTIDYSRVRKLRVY